MLAYTTLCYERYDHRQYRSLSLESAYQNRVRDSLSSTTHVVVSDANRVHFLRFMMRAQRNEYRIQLRPWSGLYVTDGCDIQDRLYGQDERDLSSGPTLSSDFTVLNCHFLSTKFTSKRIVIRKKKPFDRETLGTLIILSILLVKIILKIIYFFQLLAESRTDFSFK